MGHRSVAGIAGLLLALALAVPVSANSLDRFSFDDVLVETYTCGVVITTRIHGDGIAHLDANGDWLFTSVRLRYAGEAFDPESGATLELESRQILTETPASATSHGQGIFLRLPGEGVVLMDVGRLVFDYTDGSTIAATPHVIPFDDPGSAARIDAAVCSLFD